MPDQNMHGSMFFLRETRLPCSTVPFGKVLSVLLQFLVGTVTMQVRCIITNSEPAVLKVNEATRRD